MAGRIKATGEERAAKPAKGQRTPTGKRGKTTSGARARTAVATVPDRQIDELGALWDEFKRGHGVEARERLILHYAPLVKYVASRVATGLPSSVEQADLVSYGMFGLIDALEKFEPARGNKFETYAIPRIKGAIIDELRAMDWVPRSVRFKAREIEKAYQDLETMLKRAPAESEVAERLGVSIPELHNVINQISFVSVLALDELLSVGSDRGEQVSLLDTLADKNVDPTTGLEGQETRGLLAAAINSLSEREKIVVTLYYFEGLTLAEIGEILGVTESRVCQIHTKAVNQLRLQFVESE
ncbi:MAG TPA: RNA polymerase sigma factor WhiG [Actinomycetota bacterium]|jgi:RNA polymerase sigma factor for flagellar operon FliA|nr:RNA polymerase sigma factor WhiG [Actinomycetota bacterium]